MFYFFDPCNSCYFIISKMILMIEKQIMKPTLKTNTML